MGFSYANGVASRVYAGDETASPVPADVVTPPTPDEQMRADDAADAAALDAPAPPPSQTDLVGAVVGDVKAAGTAVVDVLTAPFRAGEQFGATLGNDANAGASQVRQDLGDLAAGTKDVIENGQNALAGALPDAIGNATRAATGPVIGAAIGIPLGIALLYLVVTRL